MSRPALLSGTPAASFEKRTEAYSYWCSCSKAAAAKIVAHDGQTFDNTVARVSAVFINDIERYLGIKGVA